MIVLFLLAVVKVNLRFIHLIFFKVLAEYVDLALLFPRSL